MIKFRDPRCMELSVTSVTGGKGNPLLLVSETFWWRKQPQQQQQQAAPLALGPCIPQPQVSRHATPCPTALLPRLPSFPLPLWMPLLIAALLQSLYVISRSFTSVSCCCHFAMMSVRFCWKFLRMSCLEVLTTIKFLESRCDLAESAVSKGFFLSFVQTSVL